MTNSSLGSTRLATLSICFSLVTLYIPVAFPELVLWLTTTKNGYFRMSLPSWRETSFPSSFKHSVTVTPYSCLCSSFCISWCLQKAVSRSTTFCSFIPLEVLTCFPLFPAYFPVWFETILLLGEEKYTKEFDPENT